MQINSYWMFAGNCKEAVEFYERVLGGEDCVDVTRVFRLVKRF